MKALVKDLSNAKYYKEQARVFFSIARLRDVLHTKLRNYE